MIATVQFVSRLLPQDLGISQFPRGQSSPVSTTFGIWKSRSFGQRDLLQADGM